MTAKQEKYYLIGFSLLACLLLYGIDQGLQVPYFWKAGSKIFIVGLIVLVYIKRTGKNFIADSFRHVFSSPRVWGGSVIFGGAILGLILFGYNIFLPFINVTEIIADFENKYRLTGIAYWVAGIYLIFINSFLEEMFFRGFIFSRLQALGTKKIAYHYSALLFAFYHLANFQSWFDGWILGLVIVSLWIGGLIFNIITVRGGSFLAAWVAHLGADIALVWIGYQLLF